MAIPACMSITGTKQGLVTAGAFTAESVGNTYQEGHGSGFQPRSDHSARSVIGATDRATRSQAGQDHHGVR